MASNTATVEVFIAVNSNSESYVTTDGGDIDGNIDLADGVRIVRVLLEIPLPTIKTVRGTMPAQPDGEPVQLTMCEAEES